jgi:hypothetical protein
MSAETIKSIADHIKLLNSIDLGGTIAEQDTLLYEARVETTAFTDLFRDRVDLIPGTKGSGKSSLYRLISEFLRPIMLKSQVVIITGVEAAGDPVFQAFKTKFEALSDMEFENFWRVYFVALILQRFVKDEQYASYMSQAAAEVAEFKRLCHAAHVPELDHKRTLRDIVEGVFRFISIRIGNAEPGESGMSYSLIEVAPADAKPAGTGPAQADSPMFLNEIHDSMVAVLRRSEVKLWIMLDRLDEVFPRRSKLERVALRALLRTTRNFPTDLIRIKLFLRDDIFENVVLGKDGFTALSHIEARKAATLRWGPKEIQMLLVKRFTANPRVRTAFQIVKERIEQNDMEHAVEVFGRLFPPQVISGKRQSGTLDWIYHHCEDGRGVVTPRDVLDLLQFALKAQVSHMQRGQVPTSFLMGPQALREGLDELSKKKCRTYLEAEFPGFWPDIKKFESLKAEYNDASLASLLGEHWRQKTEDLVGLGFLQRRPKTNTHTIPFLFRCGMGIRQGKAF